MPGLTVFFHERNTSDPCYSADKNFPIGYTYLYYRPGEYRFVCIFPSLEYPGMVKVWCHFIWKLKEYVFLKFKSKYEWPI